MAKSVGSAATARVLLLLIATLSTVAVNATESCEKLWRTESSSVDKTPEGYALLLNRWQGLGADCANAPGYVARLALAYSMNRQPDRAREILKPLVGQSPKDTYLVDFVQLMIPYFEVLYAGKWSPERVMAMEGNAAAYVHKYPEFLEGYAILGGLQTLLDHHAAAIPTLEKAAANSEMDLSGVYRNLTISYAEVGRYDDAISASGVAVKLNKNVTSDQYFAYALARADAGAGDFRNAEVVLRVTAATKPGVRDDPEFKKTVDFVLAKEAAAKK